MEAFLQQYLSLSTNTTHPGGGITKETFFKCLGPLGVQKNLISERFFAFFDQDKDELISFTEMVNGLATICKGSFDQRIKYAFEGYDMDGDGFVSKEEMRRMLKEYFNLTIELVKDVVKTMEEGAIESFDEQAENPISSSFAAPVQFPTRHSDEGDSNDTSGDGSKIQQSKTPVQNEDDGFAFEENTVMTSGIRRNRPRAAGTRRQQFPSYKYSETNDEEQLASSATASSSSSKLGKARPNAIQIVTSHHTNQYQPNAASSSSTTSVRLTSPSTRTAESIVRQTVTQLTSPLAEPSDLNPDAAYPGSVPSIRETIDQIRHRNMHLLQARSTGVSNGESSNINNSIQLSGSPQTAATPFFDLGIDQENYPIMEVVSQEAIEQMVQCAFEVAGAGDRDVLDFDEFKKVVENDMNMLSWFEALGSVF